MKLNIIDGDTILYICLHNKKDEPEKTLEDCYKSIDLFLNNLLEQTQSTHYLLYLTVGRNFRYTINPEYKANRKKLEKPKYFSESRYYLIDKYGAKHFEDYESDDLCVFSRTFFQEQGIDCFISSSDKDIKMLEGRTYNYLKGEWVETNEEEAAKYFWTSCIAGDPSDGIKAIPKRGVKFAEKLFLNVDDYDSLRYLTFEEYINHFGERKGIEEFYKVYFCLKIIDEVPENFVIPEPIQWKKQETVEELFK